MIIKRCSYFLFFIPYILAAMAIFIAACCLLALELVVEMLEKFLNICSDFIDCQHGRVLKFIFSEKQD
jgi:hypothetical protein